MRRPLALVCDLETTGFDALTEDVIEVGLVLTDYVEIYASLESLVRPGRWRVPHDASEITVEMLECAPAFSELASGIYWLYALCDEFVAYNAPFETRFLTAELQRCGLSLPIRKVVDPMVALQGRHKRKMKLQDACELMKVELPGDYPWHRAFPDAAATLRLVQKLRLQGEKGEEIQAGRPFGVQVRF